MKQPIFTRIERDAIIASLMEGNLIPSNEDTHDLYRALDCAERDLRLTEAWKREQQVEKLSHYVSEDDVEAALTGLLAQTDGDMLADDVVAMWEPLEDKYTVSGLLDEIS